MKYARNSRFWIKENNFAKLLDEGGEACGAVEKRVN